MALPREIASRRPSLQRAETIGQGHLRASENAALETTRAYLEVVLYQRLKVYAEENYFRHRQKLLKLKRG